MKTQEQIERRFITKAPFGALVRITLQPGLKAQYRNKTLYGLEHKHIVISESDRKSRQRSLTGIYDGFHGEETENPVIEFETPTGYAFAVNCSEVADYKILRMPRKGL